MINGAFEWAYDKGLLGSDGMLNSLSLSLGV